MAQNFLGYQFWDDKRFLHKSPRGIFFSKQVLESGGTEESFWAMPKFGLFVVATFECQVICSSSTSNGSLFVFALSF